MVHCFIDEGKKKSPHQVSIKSHAPFPQALCNCFLAFDFGSNRFLSTHLLGLWASVRTVFQLLYRHHNEPFTYTVSTMRRRVKDALLPLPACHGVCDTAAGLSTCWNDELQATNFDVSDPRDSTSTTKAQILASNWGLIIAEQRNIARVSELTVSAVSLQPQGSKKVFACVLGHTLGLQFAPTTQKSACLFSRNSPQAWSLVVEGCWFVNSPSARVLPSSCWCWKKHAGWSVRRR